MSYDFHYMVNVFCYFIIWFASNIDMTTNALYL